MMLPRGSLTRGLSWEDSKFPYDNYWYAVRAYVWAVEHARM